MCRMFFMKPSESAYASGRVEHTLRSFRSLAKYGKVPIDAAPGHEDGWGVVTYIRGAIDRYVRSSESMMTDVSFDEVLTQILLRKPDAILMHMRKATIGDVCRENAHPFVHGEFSFVHNGTICPPSHTIFTKICGPSGVTDSEYLFHKILARDTGDATLVPAIEHTIQKLRDKVHFSSASHMLTSGTHTYIAREYNEQHEKYATLAYGDYATIFIGADSEDPSITIACSESLAIPGIEWSPLENHTLLVLDHAHNSQEYRVV